MNDQVTVGDQAAARVGDKGHKELTGILNSYDLFKAGTPLTFDGKSCKELETQGILPVLSFDGLSNGAIQFGTTDFAKATDFAQTKTTEIAQAKTTDATKTSVIRDAVKDAPKDKLENDIDNIKTPGRAERMHKAIEEFEKQAKLEHLTQAEKDKFYASLDALISTRDGKVSQDKRAILAEQCLEHAAHPHDIDQGPYETCNVTTLEERCFTKNPSKMAEILASVAIKGSWNGIELDERSLEPRFGAIDCPPSDRVRTFASQILNVTLVNDITQRRNPPMYYSEVIDLKHPADSGERLRFKDGREVTYKDLGLPHNPPDAFVRKPCVNIGEIQAEGTKLSGDTGFCIANSDKDDPYSKNVVHIHSKDELIKAIELLKAEHKLPAVLMVDAHNPMFNNGRKGDNVEAHVISIVDYDKDKGVLISNQWGKGSDGYHNIDDVYAATILTRKPHKQEQPKH